MANLDEEFGIVDSEILNKILNLKTTRQALSEEYRVQLKRAMKVDFQLTSSAKKENKNKIENVEYLLKNISKINKQLINCVVGCKNNPNKLIRESEPLIEEYGKNLKELTLALDELLVKENLKEKGLKGLFGFKSKKQSSQEPIEQKPLPEIVDEPEVVEDDSQFIEEAPERVIEQKSVQNDRNL